MPNGLLDDEQKLMMLPTKRKDDLLVKLLCDLKEARERLKANSRTSPRAPRSDPPWQGTESREEESEASEEADDTAGRDGQEGEAEDGAPNAKYTGVAIPGARKPPTSAVKDKGRAERRLVRIVFNRVAPVLSAMPNASSMDRSFMCGV